MAHAAIALGSNLNNPPAMLDLATAQLARLPGSRLVACSARYWTDPVGTVVQDRFLNAAALLETTLAPRALLGELQAIEQLAGRPSRAQRVHWGPRPLDLDLVLYDELVLDEPELAIPHPRLHERWFVLRPLADVAPAMVHPILKLTVRELLDRVPRQSEN